MKIEVDLTRVHDSPDLGRVAAVALLSAMPHDEARLAIEEWEAVLDTREVWRGADQAAEDIPLDLGHEGWRLQEKIDADRAHSTLSVATVKAAVAYARDKHLSPAQNPYAEPMEPGSTSAAGTLLEDCLSAKTAGALKRAGFQVLGDLESRSGEWLLSTVDRFGKGGLAEVEAAMAAAGLALSGKPGVPQRAALPGTPADCEISQSIQAGSTPATPPFLKPADEISQSEERAGPPTPHGNGELNLDARYAKLVGAEEPRETLRELCRRAEGEIGRERTWAILQACGVDKISAATADQEAAVRKGMELALGA